MCIRDRSSAGGPFLDHRTGRPAGQPPVNVFHEHAMLYLPSVSDSMPTQPAAVLDSPSSLTPDGRSQMQGLRPVPAGPCLPLDRDAGFPSARLPSATEGPVRVVAQGVHCPVPCRSRPGRGTRCPSPRTGPYGSGSSQPSGRCGPAREGSSDGQPTGTGPFTAYGLPVPPSLRRSRTVGE